jgi:L-lactate utilization protein LutB
MQKDTNITTYNKKLLELVQTNLVKNGFETKIFDDIESLKNYICLQIGKNKTIGVGGSQSIRSIGLLEELKSLGNKIITHTSEMDAQTRINTWLEAQKADFYLASPQAVTINGELIFLDAYGNRVAACIYGPKKVILVCGINKIVKDIETGIWRARNIAAVINNIRLGRKNPCVVTGQCEDCDSKTRICNILVVIYKKPQYTDYEILLVNEELGF